MHDACGEKALFAHLLLPVDQSATTVTHSLRDEEPCPASRACHLGSFCGRTYHYSKRCAYAHDLRDTCLHSPAHVPGRFTREAASVLGTVCSPSTSCQLYRQAWTLQGRPSPSSGSPQRAERRADAHISLA